jgi:hypothetical protein
VRSIFSSQRHKERKRWGKKKQELVLNRQRILVCKMTRVLEMDDLDDSTAM